MTGFAPHFPLAEMTTSQAAARRGLDNMPTGATLERLRLTSWRMENIRNRILGSKVCTVSSAYRAPAVNAAVGGAATSSHVQGDAVDFNCFSYGPPLAVAQAIAANPEIEFDQIIHEFGSWIHIGFGPRMRRQLLTIDSKGTRAGLLPIRKAAA